MTSRALTTRSMASNLPAELLEEIFLHLEDTADLASASATCASFRRVVSDHRFQRRFRSNHRRPLLGLLENASYFASPFGKIRFHPVQSPRRTALAAAACADAVDFTFLFIPGPSDPECCWRVSDARDGRVLLYWYRDALNQSPPILVVCDPLHRRHVEIPPIPGHLLDAAAFTDTDTELMFVPFLAPALAAADEVVDEFSFQVICNAFSETKLVAFAFSSASGQWHAGVSFSSPSYVLESFYWQTWVRQPAHGCFYWTNVCTNFMLVLDMHGMKFFLVKDIPRQCHGQSIIVVEAAEEGRLGLLLVLEDKLELHSIAGQGNNGGVVIPEPAQEWRHDRTIPMFAGLWRLSGAGEGYALLQWCQPGLVELSWAQNRGRHQDAHYFTVDLKTFRFERLCVLEFSILSQYHLYANFPPPFSRITV